jgi:hypothetical protein
VRGVRKGQVKEEQDEYTSTTFAIAARSPLANRHLCVQHQRFLAESGRLVCVHRKGALN